MGNEQGRRARKKAQTRDQIRRTAHEMFAARGFEPVTIAEIATAADVAVQTVFNHFPTKEDLFFDGRGPLADEPAEAVRSRAAGVSPLTALRTYLVQRASEFVLWRLTGEGRSYTETIVGSPALLSHEQRLLHDAEQQLAAALAEAWQTDPEPGLHVAEHLAGSDLPPRITAAMWMATIRVIVVEHRPTPESDEDPEDVVVAVQELTEQLLGFLQASHHEPRLRLADWHLERAV